MEGNKQIGGNIRKNFEEFLQQLEASDNYLLQKIIREGREKRILKKKKCREDNKVQILELFYLTSGMTCSIL